MSTIRFTKITEQINENMKLHAIKAFLPEQVHENRFRGRQAMSYRDVRIEIMNCIRDTGKDKVTPMDIGQMSEPKGPEDFIDKMNKKLEEMEKHNSELNAFVKGGKGYTRGYNPYYPKYGAQVEEAPSLQVISRGR